MKNPTDNMTIEARELYGLIRDNDAQAKWEELMRFVFEHIDMCGGAVVRLSGDARIDNGYPHAVFGLNGVACAAWLISGRAITVEEKNTCMRWGKSWSCGVIKDREGFVKFVNEVRGWKVERKTKAK